MHMIILEHVHDVMICKVTPALTRSRTLLPHCSRLAGRHAHDVLKGVLA